MRYRLDTDPHFDNVDREWIRTAAATINEAIERDPRLHAIAYANVSGMGAFYAIAPLILSAVNTAVNVITSMKREKDEEVETDRVEIVEMEPESAWYGTW